MKNTVLILALFISTLLTAQNPLDKKVGDFSEVKVYDRIEVNLIQSDVNLVVIT